MLLFCAIVLLCWRCGKDVSTSPPLPKPTNSGKLFIQSSPSNARIYLDGRYTTFNTPDTVPFIEPGNHKLTVRLPYYKDSNVTVNIKQHSTSSENLDFINNPNMWGGIECKSLPTHSQIIIDGVNTNKVTPAEIGGILPGIHTVVFKHKGYWDDTSKVEVYSTVYSYLDKKLQDTLTWVLYNTDNSGLPTNNTLSCIAIEKGWIKWIGTLGNGLVRFDDQSWKVYNIDNSGIPGDNVTFIYVDNDGKKWVGTNRGLGIFDDVADTWEVYTQQNSEMVYDYITGIVRSSPSTIWISTQNKGLVKFEDGKFYHYTTNNSLLPDDNFGGIVVDHDGYLWAGCGGPGVLKFTRISPKTMTYFYRGPLQLDPPFPKGLGIWSMAVGNDNSVWIGFSDPTGFAGACVYYKDGLWGGDQHSPGSGVADLVLDKNNKVWFATRRTGIWSYKDSWEILDRKNSPMPTDWTYSINIDGDGNIWIGTFDKGLVKYKGNK